MTKKASKTVAENAAEIQASMPKVEALVTATGRAYTVVAQRGDTKLLVNVSYGIVPSAEGQSLGMKIRSMERGPRAFNSFPTRHTFDNDEPDVVRHMALAIGIAPYPCHPSIMATAMAEQKVVAKTIEWLKAQVAMVGGEMVAADELLTIMIEGEVANLPESKAFPEFVLPTPSLFDGGPAGKKPKAKPQPKIESDDDEEND